MGAGRRAALDGASSPFNRSLHSFGVTSTVQALQPPPLPPSAISADISIRSKAEASALNLLIRMIIFSLVGVVAASPRPHTLTIPYSPNLHQMCAVSAVEVRQQWLAMSPWAHAAVASLPTTPDALAGIMSLSPAVAVAAASADRSAGPGDNGSAGAQLLLIMTRDESLPIGIRELCSQQAASRILQQINQCDTDISPEYAWSLLQPLLPSSCDAAVIVSMRTLHFATALSACASDVSLHRRSASCRPSLFVQLLCDFDVQRVMQAACVGCRGQGRLSQVCCRHVVAAALQLMGIECAPLRQRVCAFMQSAAALHLQLLHVLLQQLPAFPKGGCYSALLTSVAYGVLSSDATRAAAAATAAISAAVSPYCYEEFTDHVLAAARPYLRRWQAQELRRTCEANAMRCGRRSWAGTVLRLQSAWTIPVSGSSCWGLSCGSVGLGISNDFSNSSGCSNCLPSSSLSIVVTALPVEQRPDVSHSTQHYMEHHAGAKANARVQLTLANDMQGLDVVVAGIRMRDHKSFASDDQNGRVQWLRCELDSCLLLSGSRCQCTVTFPSACHTMQLQLCCFVYGSGRTCCSPWLRLDDVALFLMQPLPCSHSCLSRLLRMVSDRCSHRARASVVVADCNALEVVVQRFPSRADEAVEGGRCSWLGAATCFGHVVCRVVPCVMLRVCKGDDGGDRIVQVHGVVAHVAGDDADVVLKVRRSSRVFVSCILVFLEFVFGFVTLVQIHEWFVSIQHGKTFT